MVPPKPLLLHSTVAALLPPGSEFNPHEMSSSPTTSTAHSEGQQPGSSPSSPPSGSEVIEFHEESHREVQQQQVLQPLPASKNDNAVDLTGDSDSELGAQPGRHDVKSKVPHPPDLMVLPRSRFIPLSSTEIVVPPCSRIMQGISFEQNPSPYLSPITPVRPSWPFPDPQWPWMLQTASFVATWSFWAVDIEETEERQAFLEKVRNLAKSAFRRGFEDFVNTASGHHVIQFRTGMVDWARRTRDIQNDLKRSDVLKIIAFVAGYAEMYGPKDAVARVMMPKDAKLCDRPNENGHPSNLDKDADTEDSDSTISASTGHRDDPGALKRKAVEIEDPILQETPPKRIRCRSESPSMQGSPWLLAPKLVLSQFGLSLNDVMFIKNMKDIRSDATFSENRSAIIEGLKILRRPSARLRKLILGIVSRPSGEPLPDQGEPLNQETHVRIVGPLVRGYRSTLKPTGRRSRNPVPLPGQIRPQPSLSTSHGDDAEHVGKSGRGSSSDIPSGKSLAVVIEKKSPPVTPKKTKSPKIEYHTVPITSDLHALVSAIAATQKQNTMQRLRGSIAEELGRLADKNTELKAFNGQIFSRKSTVGQNQAYDALATFLSSEVSTVAGGFLPGPNEDVLKKAKEMEKIGIVVWYTKDQGGILKNITPTATAQTIKSEPTARSTPSTEEAAKTKLVVLKTKPGHNPEDFADGIHTYKSVTYEFRSLRTTLTERMDTKRRFEAKVRKALADPDAEQYRYGHYSIGGTTYVKI